MPTRDANAIPSQNPFRSASVVLALAGLAGLLAMLAPAQAQAFVTVGGSAEHLVHYQSLTAIQWNPLGIQSDLTVGYRYRLYSAHHRAFADNFLGSAVVLRLNPAFIRLGGGLEVQPLTVLTLRVLYEHRAYFGSSGMLQSFPSAASEHSDLDLRRRSAVQGLNYPGTGHQVTLQAVLKAAVGPVAVLDDFAYLHFDMDLWRGDQVWYEALSDTLVPARGGVIQNSAHLLYLHSPRWILGVRYTLIHALYSDEAQGGDGNPNTPTHRLGPMLVHVFDGSGKGFQAPTLIVFCNWWIQHRYRTGEAVHPAIPYGVIALQFTGDLWSK